MNFFEHQDQAKKRTSLLVLLFCAAVLCLIAISVFAISSMLYFVEQNSTSPGAIAAAQTSFLQHFMRLAASELTLYIAAAIITVVGLGSFWKYLQLGSGGETVALALGGRKIQPDTQDVYEKRALNVVEEMAIASGNPVPQVYLLNDDAINAFAAGLNRRDAVIGVTRGTIRLLTRDELQGVVAHEFSHIHNGDMRLNLRLTGVLHGILLIGLIGRVIMSSSSSHRYHMRASRNKNGSQIAILGLVLFVIGYVGTFFGGLIKSAVSRQREFLADASAVQFTRNTDGISGALKKIGGLSNGAVLNSPKADEFSHFYFAQGVHAFLGGLTATHPPLKNRIKKIEPRWNERFIEVDLARLKTENQSTQATSKAAENMQSSAFDNTSGNSASTKEAFATAAIVSSIAAAGTATKESLHAVRTSIDNLPTSLTDYARNTYSARAVIYSLLIDDKKSVAELQVSQLRENAHPSTFKVFERIFSDVTQLSRSERYMLFNLCVPSLKSMSFPQYKVFKKNLIALIKSDNHVSLYEWCLYQSLTKILDRSSQTSNLKLKQCTHEIRLTCYLQ